MGFIFGIVHFDACPTGHGEIDALGKALSPEGFDCTIKKADGAAIGFCHNPQQMGKGGMYSDSDLMVVADIRIYNQDSIKESITCDSPQEAFAKAYKRWGTECANHINGDFSAVVIDLRKKEVLLFRDHIGTRPLVYWKSGNQLIFASHEFGLAKSGLIPLKISESKLIDTFLGHHKRYSETNFHNVFKVIPGHCIAVQANGSTTCTPYWKPETIRKDKSLTFDQTVTRLRETLVQATVRRMEPGTIGIHVSGGLDSCGVASIVADQTGDKTRLKGYSWSPDDFDIQADGFNEKELIDAFAKEKNMAVKYLHVDKYEMALNAIQPEFEKQTIEHPVMKAAQKDGVKTIFSGWGGDEFVSLSNRGTVNHLFFSLKWKTLLDYIKTKGIKHTLFQFRKDVLPLLVPFGLLPVYRSGYTDWSILRLFKLPFILKHWKQLFFTRKKNIFGYGDRSAFMFHLLKNYHLPERMESWAINAERYGIEYKYPLLDKEVLEFWFSSPVEYTYKDFAPRLLYREAMKGILTEDIRTRKNKKEDVFEAFSRKGKEEGRLYLMDVLSSILPNNPLHFLKPESLQKEIRAPFSKDQLKSIKNYSKCSLFIRYALLAEKYVTGPEVFMQRCTREYLFKRHRLSHQQVDRWLGENSGTAYLSEKIKQLEAVKHFLQVTDLLQESGVSFACIKGPLLSWRIYGDPAVRLSHDIDLLIGKEHLGRVIPLMLGNGYRLSAHVVWPEKPPQQEFFMGVRHNLSFIHQAEHYCVEVHWVLMHELPVSPRKISGILCHQMAEVPFSGRLFTVLSPEFELLYLLIHGARHGWSRLKWLVDIKEYPFATLDGEVFWGLVRQLKAERILAQTDYLMKRIFEEPLRLPEPSVTGRGRPVADGSVPGCRPGFFIRYAMHKMASEIQEPLPVRELIRLHRYLWLLFPGFYYKTGVLARALLRPEDLSKIDSRYKVVYYLYRPFSFIKRRISHA